MRNHYLALILALGLLIPGVLGQTAPVPQGTALSADLLRYEPNPAEPGDTLKVYITISNEGTKPAHGVRVELLENYPFSPASTSQAIEDIGSVPAAESALVVFHAQIDKDAPEGSFDLKIRYRSSANGAWQEERLSLDVATNDAAIAINDIRTEPEVPKPGERATITLEVTNLADSRLRDLAVKLETERTIGSATSELPFTPIGSSLEKRIDEMRASQTRSFSFPIIIDPEAASGVYSIPLEVSFSDERDNDYTYTDEVGLVISAQPMLDVYIDSAEIYTDERTGDVTLKFVNRGLSEIKLLNIELVASDAYTMLSGSPNIYIGNIDSDDFDTQTITITADGDTLEIPVRLHYLDALNNEFDEQKTLRLELTHSSNGSSDIPWIPVLIGLAIIAAAGYWWYRRLDKRKR